jgi:hypothetical protein
MMAYPIPSVAIVKLTLSLMMTTMAMAFSILRI